MKNKFLALFFLLKVLLMLAGCASGPPENVEIATNNRLVMQVIDGRFYKWLEIKNSNGSTDTYMLEPQNGFLSRNEAASFYTASRRWQNCYQAKLSSLPSSSLTSLSASALGTEPVPDYKTTDFSVNFPLNLYTFQGLVDNRTAVSGSKTSSYPYYICGFLSASYGNQYMRGSGFLISPHVVLTNAHNLYDVDAGGWFADLDFSPGQYESASWPNFVAPFGTKSPVLAEANQQFIVCEDNKNREQAVRHDYGALFFEEPFTGIDTFVPLEFNVIPGALVVPGYPGVVKDTHTMGLWLAEGKLLGHDPYCLFYDAYTSGGSSGSPVLSYDSQTQSYRVVALHSFASPGNFSGGPHLNNLNQDLIEKWLKWRPGEPVAVLSLNKTALTLKNGDTQKLVATISPASKKINLTWISNNEDVATVDESGLVQALSPGQAVIKVQSEDGGLSAGCTVTVKAKNSELNTPGSEPGDVNGDGTVNVNDVVMAMQHVLLINELGEEEFAAADVNCDDTIDVLDVTLLMQHCLGLIPTF